MAWLLSVPSPQITVMPLGHSGDTDSPFCRGFFAWWRWFCSTWTALLLLLWLHMKYQQVDWSCQPSGPPIAMPAFGKLRCSFCSGIVLLLLTWSIIMYLLHWTLTPLSGLQPFLMIFQRLSGTMSYMLSCKLPSASWRMNNWTCKIFLRFDWFGWLQAFWINGLFFNGTKADLVSGTKFFGVILNIKL